MAKKLKGDSFFLSANDLKTGSVVYFDGDDWSSKIDKAKKINRGHTIEDSINAIKLLKDRGIIYINGKDAQEFLQNIVTNDIKKVSDTSCCFASLLTPQGKYLFDFIIIKHKNGYFLDCEKKQVDKLVD